MGARRASVLTWSSVSAVPSGATTFLIPAWWAEMTSVYPSTMITNPSAEMDFPTKLQERVDKGDIPQSAVQKIAYDNGKVFYGL